MKFAIYGINYKNPKGAFCRRTFSKLYFLSHFRTDYVAELNGKMVEGHAFDMMLIPPGSPIYHGPTDDAEEGFQNDYLYVGGEDMKQLLSRYPLPLNEPFSINTDFYLANAITRIKQEKSFGLFGAEEKCDLYFTEAMIDIFRVKMRSEGLNSFHKIEYTRGTVMQELDQGWTLEKMAELAGYSASRFSALYKEVYGISPIRDLVNARIEKAKLLLRYGDRGVFEIAGEVGFSSIYYFSKHFKKIVGFSPLAYRAKHKK